MLPRCAPQHQGISPGARTTETNQERSAKNPLNHSHIYLRYNYLTLDPPTRPESLQVQTGAKHRVVRTACNLCQNFCGILVHVENEKVVRVEGDPDNPRNMGHLCARGLSGFVSLYNPGRIVRPMMRTNPEKGLGVDPQWKEVQWDEAINLVAERIKSVLAKKYESNPNRILFATFDHWAKNYGLTQCWCETVKAEIVSIAASCYCGNAIHHPSFLNAGYWAITPDAELSKYILLLGSQAGSMVHFDTMNVAKAIAEKRPGSVKVVAVDPLCSHAASKAEEWIPIRPGTDTAFILGLVNLLVNEYNTYDESFLKKKTNAPYLIGPDGKYVREPKTQKPLVWDKVDNIPKTFDAEIKDHDLQGEHLINDVRCRPGFQLLREHVQTYSPAKVAEWTTVPEATTRRIAQELGEAASIGSNIEIDGKEYPYRPVAFAWYRGLGGHRHAYLSGLAALLLPTLLGVIQVPGGVVGHMIGHAAPTEYVTEDGLMAVKAWHGAPYPPRQVRRPRRVDLYDLFPVAPYSYAMVVPMMLHPESLGFAKNEIGIPEILFTYHDNSVKNSFTPEIVAQAYKKIPLIVAFALEMDETTSLADVVFPDVHQFERLAENLYLRPEELGYWYCAKPAVSPPFDAPYDKLMSNAQILLEIAKRAGFLGDVYGAINRIWEIKGTPFELDPKKEYAYHELVDIRLRSWLGPEHDLQWLLSDEGGLLIPGTKNEAKYKGSTRDGKLHLYYEFMAGAGEAVKSVTDQMELQWDTSDYEPLPSWKPCSSYSSRGGEFDLYAINYKVPMQAHSVGRSNPALRQLVNRHGLDAALINPLTAERKGIRDGDQIWVESAKGNKIKTNVRLSERVHPEVIATLQHRLAKGADFNSLVSLDKETFDFVSCAIDSCILVKAYKA